MQINKINENKKGAWGIEEAGQLILGIIAAALTIILFFILISPNYNENDEKAKSYRSLLEEQLAIAKKEGIGEFHMWPLPAQEEQATLYLVHFAQELRVEQEDTTFISEDNNKKQLCICTKTEIVHCKECENLKNFASLENNNQAWVINQGEKVIITYDEKTDTYTFTKQEKETTT